MKLKGFSLVELMLAGALFTLFASGMVEVLLFGLENDRLGEETTFATAYASEGIEAVRSIRAKRFDDLALSDATGIARNDSGDWHFSGNEYGWEIYPCHSHRSGQSRRERRYR